MKQRMWTVLTLAVLATVTLACGAAGGPAEDKTSSPPGERMATVEQLWADVPALPDATAQLDAALPQPLRLLADGFVRRANTNASGDGVRPEGFDFIVYETGQTVDGVIGFYSPAKMTAQGWTAAVGCNAPNPTSSAPADLCAFTKRTAAGADDFLILVPFPSEATQGRTQVAYIRAAGAAQP